MRVEKDAASLDGAAVEGALVRRFQDGCPESTEQLFGELAEPLEATMRRLLGWPADRDSELEDMLQNVFLAAWEHRARFRGDSSIKTWLTRIAINECRRMQRRRFVFRKWWTSLRPQAAEIVGVDEPLARRETSQQVRLAMQQLSDRQREVVVLYYLEEMNAHEVAEVLGLKQGTVEARLSRARQRLATLLGDMS